MKKLGLITLLIIVGLYIGTRRVEVPRSILNEEASEAPQANPQKPASTPSEAPANAPAAGATSSLNSSSQNAFAAVEKSPEQISYEASLERIMNDMPTMATKSKPTLDADGDFHGFVKEELIEARQLGALHALAVKNPQFASSTQVTYAGCAERSDLNASVRAVCFMRALELSLKLKNPQQIAQLDVPLSVRELAKKLVN